MPTKELHIFTPENERGELAWQNPKGFLQKGRADVIRTNRGSLLRWQRSSRRYMYLLICSAPKVKLHSEIDPSC